MAKNKLKDLNDHIFAQIERLNDETLEPEQIQQEIEKTKALESLSKQVIDIHKIHLQQSELIVNAMDKGILPVQQLSLEKLSIGMAE